MIFDIVLISVFFLIIGIMRLHYYMDFEKEDGTVYIKARVYKKRGVYQVIHGDRDVYYTYKYDGISYKGRGPVTNEYFEKIEIGDSILVGISARNPQKSRVADDSSKEISFVINNWK